MPLEGTPHSLTLKIETSDDVTVVYCAGDLVGSGCGYLRDSVSALLPNSKRIVLDMAELEWIDSMGLGTLVRLHVQCKKVGCVLQLDHVGKQIRELLSLTNLLGIFA